MNMNIGMSKLHNFAFYIIPFAFMLVISIYCVTDINAGFWNEKARGWHWYEDPKIKEEKKEEKLSTRPQINNQTKAPTAKEVIAKNKEILEESLSLAILEPTPENIKKYQELQDTVMKKSSIFADSWMRSLLYNPNLDYRLKNPVAQYAIKMNTTQKLKEREHLIKNAAKEYGFFYFFQGNCKFCHAFVPILKMFVEKYDWSILSVSMDGRKLPGLEEIGKVEIDNGISTNFNVQATPSLFLINPKTSHIIPIGAGMMSLDDLEDNIQNQILHSNNKLQNIGN